ncbi:MAG: methylenetetrahydrofolate--tRNA-(uracil(54)-C(5))-methyltransferase (FADH(2)-oxidizing) TrmFO [Candidatus Dadabacteria bacterium]|nr:methylenetetrahydrofolate--tRNA-(uracil(54)-C(5))-methyltransferase (FADH(2)-oxidizing) TrmFO [Candidatus Dadabacteria bacterium]MDE0292070.1 methylenetetrahydrofolate--tRNA-(uracil(54)-C(5))-methyltransferase (FADH(2)-oxidizing) TrmFO [Candidatus Dadabacteria bacterium]MDE0476506.1 methylenetetrahydrofolate--tRNA-(uracil(54)-C(5))-methyltransferase (FADH(2)-oxidizing) TrmFO [Candidatus Dadabacteria bacterium]
MSITVIGAGLAGVEAANQISKFGVRVTLYEMRPRRKTAAHRTSDLAELVCSNSLKSASMENASGILKEEMRRLGSLVIEAAEASKVPAGKALAVDREMFSDYITRKIQGNELIDLKREEVTKIPENGTVVVATGPLTSDALCAEISSLTESEYLYFYDAISPIIDADTIDRSKIFRGSRYGHGDSEEGDYLNCPLSEDQYYELVDDLIRGEKVETREFEKALYFQSCMPVEVICERGRDTLRFGPLKPVGLIDPRTGKTPFAVLQLRTENSEETMYNMVGFQTKLRYPQQRTVFRKIPGLERAEFLRYGSVHRNTYIDSPRLLEKDLSLSSRPGVFFAGQITGVEGYVESAATGIVCGINASRKALGLAPAHVPRETSIGSLLEYISTPGKSGFQPMNINFGLFPKVERKMGKEKKRRIIAQRAIESMSAYDPFYRVSAFR